MSLRVIVLLNLGQRFVGHNKQEKAMRKTLLAMFVFALFIGCGDVRDQVVFDDEGDVFNFDKLDADRDGYISGTFTDACHEQLSDPVRVDDCLDSLDEDGMPKIGTASFGLQANDCDDSDATVYPGAPELCDGRDNDCDEAVDEEIVCDCLSDSDCDDGLFCNGTESCLGDNTCQAGSPVCAESLVCDEDGDICVECLSDGDCESGVCVDNTCVGCSSDLDCAETEFCTAEHACEPVVCVDDGDECTKHWVDDHTCFSSVAAGCCHTDADCVGADGPPTDLPDGYLWGCSTEVILPDEFHVCTSCVDADGDGFCGAEACLNGWDDDGDGVVDEADCVSSDICDLYGAWIENKGETSLDVVYHTYSFDWLLVVPPDPLPFPYQNFGAMTLEVGVPFGDDCILGVDLVPSGLFTRGEWLAMSNAEQQDVCECQFTCYNAQGLAALPVINPADPEHSCFCPYNATPVVP